MTWYVASLLFESVNLDTPDQESLWEERLILLAAESIGAARKIATERRDIGSTAYSTDRGGQVHWIFRVIERIYEIQDEELQNGTEVFCRFLRDSEVKSLLTKFPDD